ncbi:MAG TPA: hypothetical protein VGP46_11795, partial [Acidimicrobiales bacterium]|nr:hypothetical protein [Acidimicrobiales bacterium]
MASDPSPESSATPWNRRDWRASVFMTAVPTVVLTVAALAGYPLITGDDLVQNFPLEELTGQIIRAGHMPLFDSYLWSGTPLLGGTNAHSFLPITLLFALLPPLVAWVVGEALVFALAAVGTQLLLRRTGCSTLAAAMGGATFGLGGFFSSQIVHIDFASAAVSLPWALVALDGLGRRASGSHRHALLLATAVAWLCLAGSPDIVIDAAVACGAYSIHLLINSERRQATRPAFLAWSAVGALAGTAIGSLQWLTSARFVEVSERAHPSFAFISGGSLTGANFLELLVPHLLGGGSFGIHGFGGTFPLAEVDAYPGTLALVAVFALLAGALRPEASRWRIWLAVAAAGLLIASGDHTPLEHLLAHLPLTGSERLPSRALILVALAAAMLVGYFVDDLLAGKLTPGQRIAGAVPLLGVVAVVAATLATGKPAGGALVPHGHVWSVTGVLPYLALSLLLAAGAAGLLFYGTRLPVRRLVLAVVALVVVDLAASAANQSSLVPSHASALTPAYARQIRTLANGGRYLVIDPSLTDGPALDSLGAPDVGVIDGLPDAGGYGSLLWGPYSAATGTHAQDAAAGAGFTDGTFASLDVRVVLVAPGALTAALAAEMARGGWRRSTTLAGFSVFADDRLPGLYTAPGGHVTLVAHSAVSGRTTLRVTSPRPTRLLYSEADVPGWQATVSHDGRTTTVTPARHGLIQSV